MIDLYLFSIHWHLIIGLFIGAAFGIMIMSLVVIGKEVDLVEENNRLKQRLQSQSKKLLSAWRNWKEEKLRADLLEKANEELEAEKNQLSVQLNTKEAV